MLDREGSRSERVGRATPNKTYAGVQRASVGRQRSSVVEHSIRNRAVVGSIPTAGSRKPSQDFAGVIQLVECQLPKLDVAGSSPVARSLEFVRKKLQVAGRRR